MTQQMRQRLIGILVIIAIFAMLLPILLYKSPSTSTVQLIQHGLVLPSSRPTVMHPQEALLHPSQEPVTSAVVPASTGWPAQGTTKAKDAVFQNHDLKYSSVSMSNNNSDEPKVVKHALSTPRKPIVVAAPSAHRSVVHHRLATALQKTKQPQRESFVDPMLMPQAWVVEVASFYDVKHAMRLIQKLRHAGFDTYFRSTHSEKTIIRVYVGPEIQYKAVQVLQYRLKKRYHLDGLIMKYRV